jgi:hypothetical protein
LAASQTNSEDNDRDSNRPLLPFQPHYINAKQFKVGAKTSTGVRSIHILDVLIEQLKKERIAVVGHKLKQGQSFNDYDLVDCTCYGNPLDSVLFPNDLKPKR